MPSFSVIDSHPQRQRIIDQILAGVGVRDIARLAVPPVSPMTVQRYRASVVKPAAQAATVEQAKAISSTTPAVNRSFESEVRTQIQQSPVRARLETIWAKTEQMMAESDVENGAPWVNAGTKQVELLAKLTGELQQSDGPAVNIQIVIPGSGPAMGSASDRIDLENVGGQCFEMSDKSK